ncbi:PREDICTED: uncharacterized protein LOC109163511 [Ipomoea nil]|uniref:uncharacterized protein LOC109163511 n=1 Tax=Ipomoea nil TaxID=35883 RepID=UPI0009012D63|nr:PREDICTED: uncharacterized protein LOC109163511 [Ipomoea nil]
MARLFLASCHVWSFPNSTELPCPPAVLPSTTAGDEASDATVSTTIPNPAYAFWIQQDQAILSLLVSSLADEVMYLAVGRNTSREVWLSVTAALGSSTSARCLNLIAQFQSLRQGDSTPAEYLGRAQLIVEDLALAGRPMSLDEQSLYVFRGLRPEFRAMAALLAVTGTLVTIPQLSDFLHAQQFIFADDFPASDGAAVGSPTAMVASRGRRQNNTGGSGGCHQSNNGQNRGRNNGRGRGGQGGGRGGRTPRCQICRNYGHIAANCYHRYSGQPQANMVVAGDDVTTAGSDAWFPDTGASSHATPDPSMIA